VRCKKEGYVHLLRELLDLLRNGHRRPLLRHGHARASARSSWRRALRPNALPSNLEV